MDTRDASRAADGPVFALGSDIAPVSNDLSAAFRDDPIFRWFMRDDRHYDAARLRFFHELMRDMAMPVGEVMRPASGGAAAVWLPSENLGPASLWRELASLPMLLNATGLMRFGRLTALRKALDARHGLDRPHDYLWFLGVAPQVQGRGIGSRLLGARLKKLDATGRCAYLETATERNVALYLRHGFEVTDRFHVAEDAPPMWTMWREPRSGADDA